MPKTKLRRLLDERGISAYSMAKTLKMSPRTLQAIAAGTCSPSIKTAAKIAKGLNVNVAKLF